MAELDRLETDALVLVCDSRKAVIYRNGGAPIRPELTVVTTLKVDPNDVVGTADSDRAGRRSDRGAAGTGSFARSAMEQTDAQRLAAERLAGDVVATLSKQVESGTPGLVIVAPPEFLGILRNRMGDDIRRAITAEIHKNLTHLPPHKAGEALVAGW